MQQFENYAQDNTGTFLAYAIRLLFQTNQEMQSNNVMFQ